MYYKPLVFGFFLLTASQLLRAQDSSLLSKLSDSMSANPQTTYITGTFKATHIVNMQTVESPANGAMIFLIQHRFGAINTGSYNFFGLDGGASIRIALDYGLTDRLNIGIGRSSTQKTYDGYLKYKLLRQTDGNNKMPVSVSVLGTISKITDSSYTKQITPAFGNKPVFTLELPIARKISSSLSLQLTPTYISYNYKYGPSDKMDIFALGIGGRLKITKRMSLDAEYNYLLPNQLDSFKGGNFTASKVHNSFSLGWEMETGGHVFQLVFSNSQTMLETQYLTQTTGSWGKGDIYFGFNISRNFNLKKKRHTYSDTPNEKTDHP
jgi:hypothetical protein